jgi:SAM-dependent methyltransferase
MHPHLYETFFDIEDYYWWSVGTRRIFFDLLISVKPGGSLRALDIGCGTGVTLKEFPAGWAMVAGCDFSQQALSYCQRRGLGSLVRCDATQLPFASGSLDVVLALDVIEHLDDDAACVREMVRSCRPGGHVLVHVPAFPLLWNEKDVLNHHRRRYRRAELLGLLESAGLSVERVLYVNFFVFPIAVVIALYARVFRRRQLRDPDPCTLDQLHDIPRPLNRAMIALLDFERWLGKRIRLPFGMSLLCLARKTTNGADGSPFSSSDTPVCT